MAARKSYSEAPGAEEQEHHFDSIKDLDADQRKHVYEKFGLLERGYTIGVVGYSLNIFVLARFPEYFWILHLIKAFIYLPWRWVRFRARNMEWLMMDFCYFNTYLTIIACILAFVRITTGYESALHKYNYELIRGGFAFANGALVLSIAMFGNKLVFHEVDNTASVYIHISPALLFWTLRWGGGWGPSRVENVFPTMFEVCHDMVAGDEAVSSIYHMLWDTSSCQGIVSEFLTYPAICWIVVWGVPYYLIVFCIMKGWLERNEKATLFTYTIEDPTGNGRFVVKLPEALQPLGYMVQHFVWTIVTGFLSIAMWNSFILHSLFLAAIMTLAIHNGSTFMFRVVAARQVQGLVADEAKTSSPKPKQSPGYTQLNKDDP